MKENGLDRYLKFSITAIIVYSVIVLVASFMGRTVPDTLTVAFFAAFAGEILQCCIIKVFKLKGGEHGDTR